MGWSVEMNNFRQESHLGNYRINKEEIAARE